MGFMDTLFGSDIKTESVAATSKTQQALEAEISNWLKSLVGQDAPIYPGQGVADMPQLFGDAFSSFEAMMGGDIGESSRAAIQNLISGRPAYTFDPTAETTRWQETFATPVMAAWQENVLPGIKEGFNIPGVLYSSTRATGVSDAASSFYGQYVAPSLFSSLQAGEQRGFQSGEAAAARVSGALSLPFTQAQQGMSIASLMQASEQQGLTFDYNEWLRSIEQPFRIAQIGAGLSTAGTVDTFGFREPSMIEQLAMLASGVGSFFGGGGTTAPTTQPASA